MKMYWLGFFTLPLLVGMFLLLTYEFWRILAALDKMGIRIELKMHRDPGKWNDYDLHHNIIWERSWGPVFGGGWYREESRYMAPNRAKVNRWFGIGSVNGPCIMFFKIRDLGDIES